MPASKKVKRQTTTSRGSGLGNVKAAAKQSQGREFLKLEDGESVQARVIDVGDDFQDAWVHRVKMESKGGKSYFASVPCLDQKLEGKRCPGCKDDLPRQYQFWCNIIVRDWEDEDDDDGDAQDKILIWNKGITIAKRLAKLDERHGLLNRDVTIEREGKTQNDTTYDVDWATDENESLSEADEKLIKRKHDLSFYTKIPDFDEFYMPPGERNKGDDDEDRGEESKRRGSGFGNRRSSNKGSSGSSARRKGGMAAHRREADSKKKTTTKVKRRKSR